MLTGSRPGRIILAGPASTKELGGVRAVQRAELSELKALDWLPDTVAENVHAAFRAGS